MTDVERIVLLVVIPIVITVVIVLARKHSRDLILLSKIADIISDFASIPGCAKIHTMKDCWQISISNPGISEIFRILDLNYFGITLVLPGILQKPIKFIRHDEPWTASEDGVSLKRLAMMANDLNDGIIAFHRSEDIIYVFIPTRALCVNTLPKKLDLIFKISGLNMEIPMILEYPSMVTE